MFMQKSYKAIVRPLLVSKKVLYMYLYLYIYIYTYKTIYMYLYFSWRHSAGGWPRHQPTQVIVKGFQGIGVLFPCLMCWRTLHTASLKFHYSLGDIYRICFLLPDMFLLVEICWKSSAGGWQGHQRTRVSAIQLPSIADDDQTNIADIMFIRCYIINVVIFVVILYVVLLIAKFVVFCALISAHDLPMVYLLWTPCFWSVMLWHMVT